jgi:hypothetical protein
MSKKFIISEEEKKAIKLLYNINEQNYDGAHLEGEDDDEGNFLWKFFGKIGSALNPDFLLKSLSNSNSNSNVNPNLTNLSAKGQELSNNPEFKSKLSEISSKIDISEESILKLMNLESKLDPSVKNSIGCVGLIQFCPDSKGGSTKTINGKVYQLEDLRNNLGLQMDVIEDFWVKGKENGKIKSAKDLYIYNFFPLAAGKPDEFILKSKDLSAVTVAKSNPVYNRTLGIPFGTPLTVGTLNDFYEKTGMI